jgi:hypothetical protein
MLRALVLALLLANAGWWAWSQGWLPAGALPLPRDDVQREPQRLAAQVRPDSVQVLPSAEARRLAAATCLQAGPFDDARWPAAATAMARAGLPAAAWQRVPADEGAWLRVPEADAAQQAALKALAETDLGDGFRPCP